MAIQIIKGRIGNCYIIKHEGTILIDAGMPGEFNKFSKKLH